MSIPRPAKPPSGIDRANGERVRMMGIRGVPVAGMTAGRAMLLCTAGLVSNKLIADGKSMLIAAQVIVSKCMQRDGKRSQACIGNRQTSKTTGNGHAERNHTDRYK